MSVPAASKELSAGGHSYKNIIEQDTESSLRKALAGLATTEEHLALQADLHKVKKDLAQAFRFGHLLRAEHLASQADLHKVKKEQEHDLGTLGQLIQTVAETVATNAEKIQERITREILEKAVDQLKDKVLAELGNNTMHKEAPSTPSLGSISTVADRKATMETLANAEESSQSSGDPAAAAAEEETKEVRSRAESCGVAHKRSHTRTQSGATGWTGCWEPFSPEKALECTGADMKVSSGPPASLRLSANCDASSGKLGMKGEDGTQEMLGSMPQRGSVAHWQRAAGLAVGHQATCIPQVHPQCSASAPRPATARVPAAIRLAMATGPMEAFHAPKPHHTSPWRGSSHDGAEQGG